MRIEAEAPVGRLSSQQVNCVRAAFTQQRKGQKAVPRLVCKHRERRTLGGSQGRHIPERVLGILAERTHIHDRLEPIGGSEQAAAVQDLFANSLHLVAHRDFKSNGPRPSRDIRVVVKDQIVVVVRLCFVEHLRCPKYIDGGFAAAAKHFSNGLADRFGRRIGELHQLASILISSRADAHDKFAEGAAPVQNANLTIGGETDLEVHQIVFHAAAGAKLDYPDVADNYLGGA